MSCEELARRIAQLDPDLPPAEVARLCLLILQAGETPSSLSDDAELLRHWRIAAFRLDAAADQHAAMACELDQLCGEGPVRFQPEQIWTLLKAVKIHSQILELYTGAPSLI
ncbi:hypothetical protein [Roseimaritima ulvae]|nr:hypothetical protein [Roseimaritima ulvae]